MREVVLLESRHRRPPSPTAALVSAALHGGLILLAVVATAEGSRALRDPLSEPRIHFASPRPVQPAGTPAPERSSARRPAADAVRSPRLIPSVVPSLQVPDVLPRTDEPLFDPGIQAELREVTRRNAGIGGGLSSGAAVPYRRHEVDQPAASIPGQPGPRYPEALLRGRVEGRVRVRFVVGTDGRADGVPEILFATRPEFAESVRAWLAKARYRPASISGIPVSQLVEQEFVFELRH